MREMTAQGIIQFKSGSKERGNIWQTITKNPNYHKISLILSLREVLETDLLSF